jgi:hypothetical protein
VTYALYTFLDPPRDCGCRSSIGLSTSPISSNIDVPFFTTPMLVRGLDAGRFVGIRTFVEALGLILARGPDPIIVRRDLEDRGPSASDYPRQVSQQFDRDRVASFGHTQYIVSKSFLFGRCQVLLLGGDFSSRQPPVFTMPQCGSWYITGLGEHSRCFTSCKISKCDKYGLCIVHDLSHNSRLSNSR